MLVVSVPRIVSYYKNDMPIPIPSAENDFRRCTHFGFGFMRADIGMCLWCVIVNKPIDTAMGLHRIMREMNCNKSIYAGME